MSATEEVPAAPAGLRERSKARRRTAIQRTAMRLFAERGYDATTIAEIAEAAEVAPRTVTGYFPTKMDLATSFADEMAGRLSATFAAHPGAGFLVTLDIWLTAEARLIDRETAGLADAMYEANPALRAISTAQVAETIGVVGTAITTQVGLPAGNPMSVIARDAIGAAINAYLAVIWHREPSPELHRSVMAFLQAVADAARLG